MPYGIDDDPLSPYDLDPVDASGLLDAVSPRDPIADLENELLKLETDNVKTRSQQRKDYISRVTSIFDKEKSPDEQGNLLAKRRKGQKLRPSERAALIASALSDVGAGYFGTKSRSFEDRANRERKEIDDYTDRSQKNALNTAQLEAGAQNQNAEDEIALARTKANFLLARARDEQGWAQNLLQATSPEALYEHARTNAINKARAQAEVESQGMTPGTFEKKVNLDQLTVDEAKTLVPESMRGTRQGALMEQAIQGKIREGKITYGNKLVDLRDEWVQKVSTIMDNAEPANGIKIVSPLDAYAGDSTGLERLMDADTPEAVSRVGRELMAEASQLAQRSRGSNTLAIGIKTQVDAQKKLLSDARAAGVDFNALELKDAEGNDLGIKNALEKDKDGLLNPDIVLQLENEVSRMQTVDKKVQDAGLRAFKQSAASAVQDAEEFAVDQLEKGKTLEQIQQDWKDMIYSKYGLTGKWAAEAEKMLAPLLKKYADVFGRPVEKTRPKDRSYPGSASDGKRRPMDDR